MWKQISRDIHLTVEAGFRVIVFRLLALQQRIADVFREKDIAFTECDTWTTDAIFRETEATFAKRKADGCISVEMECAGVQAVCAFRGLKLFVFFTSGDLLDSPKWTMRAKEGQIKHTQHDSGHFEIALGLANFVSEE